MPKINVTQEIVDLNGDPIQGPPNKKGASEKMTIRAACLQALMAAEEKQTGQQRFEQYQLAQKISEEDNPMLDSKQITRIKDLVGNVFIPIVVGRVWDALELKNVAPEAVEKLPVPELEEKS